MAGTRFRPLLTLVAAFALAGALLAISALAQTGGPPDSFVILARSDNPADALAAGPVGGLHGAPILLTPSDQLLDITREHLVAAAPDLVIVAGGRAAISERVESAVQTLGFATRRVAGPDRHATSIEVARLLEEFGVPRTGTPGPPGPEGPQGPPGLALLDVVSYTEVGEHTFTKADFPGLAFVRVRVQGGGGAGRGAFATGPTQVSLGNAGGGGGYAESILAAATLEDTVSVIVGAGGQGLNPGLPGPDGEASAFGDLVIASGGTGGGSALSSSNPGIRRGVLGGEGTGDLVIPGGASSWGLVLPSDNLAAGGNGGSSALGAGGLGLVTSGPGNNGTGYGGGGSGGVNLRSQDTARDGGSGSPGIVIVEIYGDGAAS
jgi:hypothetical protein